jgi:hypothetical protein
MNNKLKRAFRQKSSRNAALSIFRQALKFILSPRSKSIRKIDKICKIHKLSVNSYEFLERQNKRLKKLKNYIRNSLIEQFLIGTNSKCNKQDSLILRILIKHFLSLNLFPNLIVSHKVTHDNRLLHLS